MIAALLLLMLQPPDTLTVTAAELLQRASEAPAMQAALDRVQASDARVRQAGLLPNPSLSGNVENLGRQEELTGVSGWGGSEGQFLVGTRIRLGGDGAAARRVAEAGADGARAGARRTEAELRLQVVEAVALLQRDDALVEIAREEARGVARLEEAVRLQTELGRASEGEAARLALARTSAEVEVARMEAQQGVSRSELLRLVGLPQETLLSIALPPCPTADPAGTPPVASPPELEEAAARVRRWEAGRRELGALAIPDLLPEVGVRRMGGVEALYLGLSVELPLFDRNQGAREAARLEARAAEAEMQEVERRLDAQHSAALQALQALEAAGSRFDEAWIRALDQAVEASEARYTLGEGTLTELLDGRRARLQALADREYWRAEWLVWRGRVARTVGRPITEDILCAPAWHPAGPDGSPGTAGEEILP